MQQFLAGLAVILCSPLALAEVAGIYMATDDPAQLVSVTRNGNSVLLVHQQAAPEVGGVAVSDDQYAASVMVYAMTYQIGQLSADGQSATVIGTGAAGACRASYQLQFSDAGLRRTLLSMQTPANSVYGVDCTALAGKWIAAQKTAGGAPLLTKVF